MIQSLAALCALLAAQETNAPAPKPATEQKPADVKPTEPPQAEPLAPGQQQVLQALVIGTEGRTEWRSGANAKWKSGELNDILDPGAEIRTGLRSTLTLRVGKNATLLVDRSSRIELPVIVQDGTVLRTRAAVYRGKCDFKVDSVGITSDFLVMTPSATVSVRGTGFSVQWGALNGIEVRGVDTNRIHAIEVAYWKTNDTVFVSGDGATNSDRHDPAHAALFMTVFPPPFPTNEFGNVGDEPQHEAPVPPFIRDFHREQEVDHGGSDIGANVQPGDQPKPPPPSHGDSVGSKRP